MFDFFEQPWTLLGAAVLVLLGMLTYRSVTDKRRAWHLVLPILIAAAGFGLDALVATDLEQVRAAIGRVLQAAEDEDCDAIARMIASDYADDVHRTKDSLMTRCRQELDGPTLLRVKKLNDQVELSRRQATVRLSIRARFEDDTRVAREYKRSMRMLVEMVLDRQPGGAWLIRRADLLEIDTIPVSWRGL